MDEEVKFTKNKRLIEKDDDGSHVGGSVRGRKSLIKNMLDEEEHRARKAFEHQQDINDAFGNY